MKLPRRAAVAVSRYTIQDPDQIRADRHQSRFVELTLANTEDSQVEIDIGQGEGERFADAKSGAI